MKAAGPDDAIRRLLDAYRRGDTTVQDELARAFARVAAVDRSGPALNTVLRIDPDAQWTARRLDSERSSGEAMGPLHGVPVLLKDNVDTGGPGGGSMPTSAGALALADSFAPADAPLVSRLRAAGALIIGKTNMTELANYLSTGMPGGYSSLGGQVVNPHHPALPVATSSSGSGRGGGRRPVSRGDRHRDRGLHPGARLRQRHRRHQANRGAGVPDRHRADLLQPGYRRAVRAQRGGRRAGAHRDRRTRPGGRGHARCAGRRLPPALRRDGLQGTRIGIPRAGFWDEQGEGWQDTLEVVRAALVEGGAEVVDPADIATRDGIGWSPVLLYEFKAAMNAYLRRLGPGAPCRTLADLIAFNAAHADQTLRYGQVWLLRAEHETSGRMDEAAYLNARAEDLRLCRTEGIDATLERHGLDALVFPNGSGSSVGARRRLPVGGGAARVRAGSGRQPPRRSSSAASCSPAPPSASPPWCASPTPSSYSPAAASADRN